VRELSREELELITGGLETIEVYGMWSDPIWGCIGSFNLWNDGFSYEVTDDYFGDSGSGGGGEPEQSCTSHDAQAVDTYSDQLASKLSRDIKAKPDDQNREYLALIYRDGNGVIRTTELFQGPSNGESASIPSLQAIGVAAAQIVGVVHNHPSQVFNTSSYEYDVNRLPSNGDWAMADQIIGAGADPNTLALYVLGTDGRLREFEYTDKSQYINPTPNSPLGDTISQSLQPDACNG
jgi:hypothetical protein